MRPSNASARTGQLSLSSLFDQTLGCMRSECKQTLAHFFDGETGREFFSAIQMHRKDPELSARR